jgi:hypothetical protein
MGKALAYHLDGNGGEDSKKGKQDKGSVSRHLLSDCLHILFSRDARRPARDMPFRNGGNPPFCPRNRETQAPRYV